MSDTEKTTAKIDNTADMAKLVINNLEPRLLATKEDGGPSAEILLYPSTMKAESVRKMLDENRIVPQRRTGTHKADRLESFIDLTNRFKNDVKASEPAEGDKAPAQSIQPHNETVIFAKGKVGTNSIEASVETIFDFHPSNADNKDARNLSLIHI